MDAAIRRTAWAALAGLLALAGISCSKDAGPGGPEVLVLCGGSFRPPVEKLVQAFEAERGAKIALGFGQSEDLLPKVKMKAQGDVFITHDPYEQYVREAGALKRSVVVGHVAPVVVVSKGNPKGVKGFADLARPGLRVALPDPAFSTAGKLVAERLKAEGVKDAVMANVGNALMRGHAEIANAIKIGARDAGIVWNGFAHNWRDALEVVPEPYAYPEKIRVTVMGLNYSKRPQAVEAFLAFAEERGPEIFRAFGYLLPGEPGADGAVVPPAPRTPPGPADRKLFLYCGAGLRPPIAEIAEAFRGERGIEVQCDYAGSEVLLGRIKVSRRGDLYLPGENQYLDQAAEAGLVRLRRDVCRWRPVLLVAKGNPKGIRTIQDLTRQGLQLGLGNPQACAIGRQTVQLFKKNKLDPDAVYRQAVFQSLTVNELGLHVKLGKIDVAIVWDATAALYAGQTEAVAIPEEQNIETRVPIAVLTTSTAPAAAEAFAEYLTSERAREILRKHHYTPAAPAGANPEGAVVPPASLMPPGPADRKLFLYCAAGLRPAIAEIAESFRDERGIEVQCDYAGSEILLGRLKVSRRGDLYLPGEPQYLDQAAAEGLVRARRDVCRWKPVLLVAKGNPKGIRTLQDLTRQGLQLGLGNPQACAIGRQTVQLFKKNGLDPDAVYRQAVFQSLTVNELGLHVKLGKIDVAIVWDAVAAFYAEQTEAVAIPEEQNIETLVPIAVLTTSTAPAAAAAFAEYLTSERAREILRKHHYTPVAPPGAKPE